MEKVKILVACHKPAEVYSDEVYTPIHVGRAISKCTAEMAGMIGDDTGENISRKNPFYSELTAQYWAWKNLHDVEYVGLCHYRRYFETKVTKENVDQLLGKDKDVMLVAPIVDMKCAGTRVTLDMCQEDFHIFLQSLKKVAPEYYDSALKYLSNNLVVAFNMFVMKKELFDKFAEWQFSILEEMEAHVLPSPYTRMRRLYGYVGEALLPIWCLHNHLNIRYDNFVSMVGDRSGLTWKNRAWEIYARVVFRLTKSKIGGTDVAVMNGLKMDGVTI